MYSSIILLATLAATVSATIPLHRRYVEARQTDASSTSADMPVASASDAMACVSAADEIDSLLAAAPTAPDDLYSYAVTATDISTQDPCSFTFPSSLASEWSSYSSAYYSWYSASASSELVSAASVCGTTIDASYYGLCSTDAGLASSTSGETVATATTTTDSSASGLTTSTGSVTKTTSSKSSGTAQATTASTAGASPREVGMVGAVLAGVLGAAVAL